MAFTPKEASWQWFSNAQAEPVDPTNALAGENAAPTLADSSIIRLRVQIKETGNTNGSGAWDLEYDRNDNNWVNLGAANHWNWANGAATEGNACPPVATYLITGSDSKGQYIETSSYSSSVTKNKTNEFDCAVQPTANAGANTLYRFRVNAIGATTVTLDSGATYPSATTAPASNPQTAACNAGSGVWTGVVAAVAFAVVAAASTAVAAWTGGTAATTYQSEVAATCMAASASWTAGSAAAAYQAELSALCNSGSGTWTAMTAAGTYQAELTIGASTALVTWTPNTAVASQAGDYSPESSPASAAWTAPSAAASYQSELTATGSTALATWAGQTAAGTYQSQLSATGTAGTAAWTANTADAQQTSEFEATGTAAEILWTGNAAAGAYQSQLTTSVNAGLASWTGLGIVPTFQSVNTAGAASGSAVWGAPTAVAGGGGLRGGVFFSAIFLDRLSSCLFGEGLA